MKDSFYRAFEDRYRGSRELIKSRQQVYVPFLQPLASLYPGAKALDLGCGRGEWLEVLLESGFAAYGVDLDEGMLEACKMLSLPAEHGDALEALRRLDDQSLAVVSGFHIVEHLPFDLVEKIIVEALRVLKPAGLLILETPNAENIVVASNNFYLDPTHERPIPHLLLSFMTEHNGFKRNKLLRLQEPKPLALLGELSLMDVLEGCSPDYAVVAQKASSEESMAAFNSVFDKDYGIALNALAEYYDSQMSAKVEAITARLDAVLDQYERLDSELRFINSKLQIDEQGLARLQVNQARLELQSLKSVNGEPSQENNSIFSERISRIIESAERMVQERERAFQESLSKVAHSEIREAAAQAANLALRSQLQEAAAGLVAAQRGQQERERAFQESLSKVAHSEAREAGVQAANLALRSQLQEATAELLAAQRGQQVLEVQLIHERQLKQDYANRLKSAEVKIQNLTSDIEFAVLEKVTARATVDHLETSVSQLTEHLDELTKKIDHYELYEREATYNVERLEDKIQDLSRQLAEKNRLLEENLQYVEKISQQNYEHDCRLEELDNLSRTSSVSALQWQSEMSASRAQLDSMVNSRSWKVTRPLRETRKAIHGTISLPRHFAARSKLAIKVAAYPLLVKALRRILANQRYKHRASKIVSHYPRLYDRLFRIAKGAGIFATFQPTQEVIVYNPDVFIQGAEPDLSDLNLEAQEYYHKLKNEIISLHGDSK